MKLSDLTGGVARTPQEPDLAYPCSSLADPPITVAEALAVDLGRDTTLCRRHRGQLMHLPLSPTPYGSLNSPQQQSYSIEHPCAGAAPPAGNA
jgi:hypothetical protein